MPEHDVMVKTMLFRIIFAVLLPVLLAACNKGTLPPLVLGAGVSPGYELVYLARDQGYLSAANLRVVEYSNPAEVKQAFRGGAVHLAGVTLEDALLLRRDIPDLKIVLILDSAKLPTGESGMDVLVTRDEYIGTYHGEMVQFLDGWRRALDYVHNEPAKAALAMAQREHMEPAQFDKAMQGIEFFDLQRNREMLRGESPAMVARIESAQRSMMGKGLLSVGVDPAVLLEASLLAGVAK
jgi:ABC-type nitrate/sulfonate/bicarbonate transport system substrate-binding protein